MGLVKSSEFLRSLVMMAAVIATSYLPVLTPARMPVQGRISCLISNGAYLRRSSTSSLSKPVGLPSLMNSNGRKSSSVATMRPRFLISSMLAARARLPSMGSVALAARAPSSTRREMEREDEYVMTEPLPELVDGGEWSGLRLTDARVGLPLTSLVEGEAV